ncbi:hypothetical protein GCM10009630_64600 [Kribbella jejuensis]|uniref:DUF3298 domain-containing protein n=1 Tax=Kribbella jejuensis TaxID=236068 RepID=A0A542EMC5_9ACTN|nr:hypothetical protein [Kribbella jejuensis]TQJ16404.1 hypothetical protein FB475_0499 [Kribbella jejuensis]
MRRRATLTAVLLLALLGCDPHPTTHAAPIGNLCERERPQLPGNWTTEDGEYRPAAPLSDGCTLVDSAQPAHRIRVLVSILKVTDAQAAKFRKDDEESAAAGGYAAKVSDGGLGDGSWALDPAAAAPWLVFRIDGRQIRLSVENAGAGTLDELRSIARSITTLPGGLPTAPSMVVRPECARGTAAAERSLGTKSVLRRDALVDKHLSCRWASATRSVATFPGGDSRIDFGYIKDAATDGLPWAHRVTVGAEAWQQDDGYLVFRSSTDQYVTVVSLPYQEMRPIPIVMLARAIAPAYS